MHNLKTKETFLAFELGTLFYPLEPRMFFFVSVVYNDQFFKYAMAEEKWRLGYLFRLWLQNKSEYKTRHIYIYISVYFINTLLVKAR